MVAADIILSISARQGYNAVSSCVQIRQTTPETVEVAVQL